MAILEYNNKFRCHPCNWVGVRVAYLGAEGVYKSKHFNFRDKYTGKMKTRKEQNEIRKEAKKLEASWKKEGRAFRDLNFKHIHYTFYLYTKKSTGKYYKTFRVGCQYTNGVDFWSKGFHIGKKWTFTQAWKECADYLMNNTDFTKSKGQALRDSMPSLKEVNSRRLKYNRTVDNAYKYSKKELEAIY